MKKLLLSVIITMLVVIESTTVVKAITSNELANQIYNIGKKYGMTASHKVSLERYLSDNPVTEEDAQKILARARSVAGIMESTGAKSYSELSEKNKNKVLAIAREAASIAELSVKVKTKEVEIYRKGKLIEVQSYKNNKLVYTGNNNIGKILVVSFVTGIALIIVFILKRKIMNA